MNFILDPCLEPVIDAGCVKQMRAGGQFPHHHPLLEVLKANHALILLELIQVLLEWLLFDESN